VVATEGRAFWILSGLSVLQQLKPAADPGPATFFKPADAYRAGGPLPTFYYWFKDQPTAPVEVSVSDSKGVELWKASGQPGAEPAAVVAGGGGRGGRGGGGGGGGRFGGGGGAGANQVYGKAGLNKVMWSASTGVSPYTTPAGVISWAHRPGPAQAPKAAPGLYTVKVTSGSWSETQTFRLETDPRLGKMTDLEGQQQLTIAKEIGAWEKTLYENVAKLRDLKAQAKAIAEKAGASSPVAAAAKALIEKATAVEGDMTQLQGSAGQDSLNFPTRLDGQIAELYGGVVGNERKIPKGMTERYSDLKDQVNPTMARSATVLAAEVAAFNAVASSAGAGTIIIK